MAKQPNPCLQVVEPDEPILKSYCNAAIQSRKTHCVWVCFRNHGKALARDVNIDLGERPQPGGAVDLRDLGRQLGWFKRFSVYGPTAVTEVQVCYFVLERDHC